MRILRALHSARLRVCASCTPCTLRILRPADSASCAFCDLRILRPAHSATCGFCVLRILRPAHSTPCAFYVLRNRTLCVLRLLLSAHPAHSATCAFCVLRNPHHTLRLTTQVASKISYSSHSCAFYASLLDLRLVTDLVTLYSALFRL